MSTVDPVARLAARIQRIFHGSRPADVPAHSMQIATEALAGVQAVLDLHTATPARDCECCPSTCEQCYGLYPCETVRLLTGQEN